MIAWLRSIFCQHVCRLSSLRSVWNEDKSERLYVHAPCRWKV